MDCRPFSLKIGVHCFCYKSNIYLSPLFSKPIPVDVVIKGINEYASNFLAVHIYIHLFALELLVPRCTDIVKRFLNIKNH